MHLGNERVWAKITLEIKSAVFFPKVLAPTPFLPRLNENFVFILQGKLISDLDS